MATILLENAMNKYYNYNIALRKNNKSLKDGNAALMKTEKKIFYKKLITLVLPIALQNFTAALVSASDALMLGLLNQTALSAVSLATQVQFVLNLFFTALTIGATVLAAQYWGNQDKESVEEVLCIALKISFLISLVFFMAAFFFPRILMRIFTNEMLLIEEGIPYLRIVSWSYLFMGFSQIYLCIMKNSGRTTKSTIYGSFALILNILLNAVLIFGLFGFPQMGIAGAALATTIARAVELMLTIIENGKTNVVRVRLKYFHSGFVRLKRDYYRYTLPVLANELVWGCGFTMFSVIMGHLGNDAVAANSVANIVKNIIACVCLGIGAGSGILIGNELGGGNLDTAKKYGRLLCKISLITGAVSGLLILLSSPMVLRFTANLTEQARAYLQIMLCICSYYMIGKSVNSTVIAGIFCAGGDTKFGFICDAVTMWLIIIPLGIFAAFILHLPILAVYFLLNLDELIKLPAVYRHYKQYKWVKNLTANHQKGETYEPKGKNVERPAL